VSRITWETKAIAQGGSGGRASIYVYVPVLVVPLLSRPLYAAREGDHVVYYFGERDDAVPVKLKIIGKHGDGRRYYSLLIPKPIVRELGITPGTPLLAELRDDALVVTVKRVPAGQGAAGGSGA